MTQKQGGKKALDHEFFKSIRILFQCERILKQISANPNIFFQFEF